MEDAKINEKVSHPCERKRVYFTGLLPWIHDIFATPLVALRIGTGPWPTGVGEGG